MPRSETMQRAAYRTQVIDLTGRVIKEILDSDTGSSAAEFYQTVELAKGEMALYAVRSAGKQRFSAVAHRKG